MNTATHKNGCHNRKPFAETHKVTGGGSIKNFSFGQPCQYTKSALGQADKGCAGCRHKATS